MSIVIAITSHWEDTKRFHAIGTLTIAGNYATGGDTLNFSIPQIKSASAPLFVDFNNLSKYGLSYVVGTLATGKLKVKVPDTGLELAAGAYPAAMTSDTITFHAIFKKNA